MRYSLVTITTLIVLQHSDVIKRLLQSRAHERGRLHGGVLQPFRGPVNLVIQPGFRFAVVQGLLTNFHLPKSSLLLLVSALIGRERLLQLYQHALTAGYRFYSYGDAMWIDAAAVQPQARPPAR